MLRSWADIEASPIPWQSSTSPRPFRPVTYRELPPRTDLKATLAAERQRLINEGWNAAPMTGYASLYCERGAERWCISIECVEPGTPLIGHGTFLGGPQPSK